MSRRGLRDEMKKPFCVFGIATVLLISSSSAEKPTSLDRLLWGTNMDLTECSLLLDLAATLSDTVGYGPNAQKTKAAYNRFYEGRDKVAKKGEARFAAIKREFALNANATAALKDLYIYWRAELAPCTTTKTEEVSDKFRLLLERVRVEASW